MFSEIPTPAERRFVSGDPLFPANSEAKDGSSNTMPAANEIHSYPPRLPRHHRSALHR